MKKIGRLLICWLMLLILVSCGRQSPQEPKRLSKEYTYDGVIPVASVDGENIKLGIDLPEVDNDWGDTNYDGEEPIFVYINPENWEETWSLEYSDRIVARVGNIYMVVTPMGSVGPVWSYCRYDNFGEFYGVTFNNFFMFIHHGKVVIVKQGDFYYPQEYTFDQLPEEEEFLLQFYAHPMDVYTAESVRIDSLADEAVIYDYSEIFGTIQIANTAYENYAMETLMVAEGKEYTLQGGRVFRLQENEIGYDILFIGAIDGIGEIIDMPIVGTPVYADQYGVYFYRDGVSYFTPYAPMYLDGVAYYMEWNAEFFENVREFFPTDENWEDSKYKFVFAF